MKVIYVWNNQTDCVNSKMFVRQESLGACEIVFIISQNWVITCSGQQLGYSFMFRHVLNSRIDSFSDNCDLLRPCFGTVSPADKPIQQLWCLNIYWDIVFLELKKSKHSYHYWTKRIFATLLTCIFRKCLTICSTFQYPRRHLFSSVEFVFDLLVWLINNRGLLLTWGCHRRKRASQIQSKYY